MGLFSRHHSHTANPPKPQDKLYVFIRASDASTSATPTWSIAVVESSNSSNSSRPSQTRTPSPDEHHTHHDKPKKPFFSLHSRHNSETDLHSSSPSDSDTPLGALTEFSLSYGTLQTTTHHPDRSTSTPTSPSTPQHLLIKILLPLQPPKPRPSSLSTLLPPLLSPTTAQHWNQTTPWLHTSLLALQSAQLLPPLPAFSAPRLVDYASNQLAALRRSDGADPVLELDYAAHLAENARLRAHFGHEAGQQDRGDEGRTMGTWWVSRPGRYDAHSATRDVYGGLM